MSQFVLLKLKWVSRFFSEDEYVIREKYLKFGIEKKNIYKNTSGRTPSSFV